MSWKIRARADGWKEVYCEHKLGHAVVPHSCDGCCLTGADFPLDKVTPASIGPLAVQHVPRAVLRMGEWETPRVILQLLVRQTWTHKGLQQAVRRHDAKEALNWLLEQGLASSGLTEDLNERTYSANVLGKLAFRMLKSRAASDAAP